MPQQLDNLVFDRTQADVSRLKTLTQKLISGTATAGEKAEWLAGMKGAYNYADLNRVGDAVDYLTETLADMGYSATTVTKTNWVESDIPIQTQMAQYLTNIHNLRNCLPYVAPNAPNDMQKLTYTEANNIEEILYTLENVLLAMQENFLLRQANTLFMIAGGVFNNA